MAGAEVGRGLRSGVITATAEDGGQTGTRFRAGNFSKDQAKSFQITVLSFKKKGRRRRRMKEKGKEIRMLSKAACAFSTGELRLFSLWFKIKSNKTPHQMVYKKQACTLQRSHTRKANLFLTLCHGFLGPSQTIDTDSIPIQLEKTQGEEFCTHGHLLKQKQTASGRETQAFPPHPPK